MKLKIPYGSSHLQVDVDDKHISGIVNPGDSSPANAKEIIIKALKNPLGTETLFKLANNINPAAAAVIISDVTRPVPYNVMLPPVLDELHRAGIQEKQVSIVIGTGCHRSNSKEETIKALGEKIYSSYKIVNHNCDGDLTYCGTMSDGTKLLLNSEVVQADLKAALGVIIPHKLAGFSGGAKAVLPGVSGRETISANHSMMKFPQVKEGNWQNNPVRKQMNEAARVVGLNFILNVITNNKNEVVEAVAGDAELAWEQGAKICRSLYEVPVPHKCPVTIVSCGGYPRDLNVYQAVKSIINAAVFTEKGGTIIACARCQEGYGDSIFAQWLKEAQAPGDIVKRFNDMYVLGGHKAYAVAELVKNHEVVLVSDLGPRDVNNLFMTYQPSLKKAFQYVEKKHGPDYRAWIIPYGALILQE
ncbi:MAG: nickel-dependent lactate racemase [Desulfotomaculum sp.]|nr:nickel-dependent lactate racemase [Desulfotomaculum sp.]